MRGGDQETGSRITGDLGYMEQLVELKHYYFWIRVTAAFSQCDIHGVCNVQKNCIS